MLVCRELVTSSLDLYNTTHNIQLLYDSFLFSCTYTCSNASILEMSDHTLFSDLSMPGLASALELFPELSRTSLHSFRTSAWYLRFQSVTIKATVLPLDDEFRRYMNADGVTIPEGADDQYAANTRVAACV